MACAIGPPVNAVPGMDSGPERPSDGDWRRTSRAASGNLSVCLDRRVSRFFSSHLALFHPPAGRDLAAFEPEMRVSMAISAVSRPSSPGGRDDGRRSAASDLSMPLPCPVLAAGGPPVLSLPTARLGSERVKLPGLSKLIMRVNLLSFFPSSRNRDGALSWPDRRREMDMGSRGPRITVGSCSWCPL